MKGYKATLIRTYFNFPASSLPTSGWQVNPAPSPYFQDSHHINPPDSVQCAFVQAFG